ncbi:hypothetical protein [Mammaliicoccus virus vB_MscM-PMS2]|nr:hypothetical protein [Mammaliicoccus virus vB_MscM-PMS2]
MSNNQEKVVSSRKIKKYAIRPVEDDNGNVVVRYAYICLANPNGTWFVDKVYGREESSETWLKFMQEMRELDRSQLKVEKWQVR